MLPSSLHSQTQVTCIQPNWLFCYTPQLLHTHHCQAPWRRRRNKEEPLHVLPEGLPKVPLQLITAHPLVETGQGEGEREREKLNGLTLAGRRQTPVMHHHPCKPGKVRFKKRHTSPTYVCICTYMYTYMYKYSVHFVNLHYAICKLCTGL